MATPISKRIESLLQKRGLTAAKLAEETGISASLLSDLRRGTGREVGKNIIITLCKYFGVSSDYLLGLSDMPDRDPERKAASSYLGLSEEVTNCLSVLVSWQEGKLKPTLEKFIRELDFFDMLENMAIYEKVTKIHFEKEPLVVDEKDKSTIHDLQEKYNGLFLTSRETYTVYYQETVKALERYLESIWREHFEKAKEEEIKNGKHPEDDK